MLIIDAVRENNIEKLSQFIASGVSPNFAEDEDGVTLLHHAAQNDCLESTIYLINAGANIYSLTRDGYSPCDIAKLINPSVCLNFYKGWHNRFKNQEQPKTHNDKR